MNNQNFGQKSMEPKKRIIETSMTAYQKCPHKLL